ncbi:MAG: transporter substrate-binding domain-containing protein [Coriobacteriia bacterium]|nr:transporter substrate-binding domain-containing protein [Coriobacteriia bacterium]
MPAPMYFSRREAISLGATAAAAIVLTSLTGCSSSQQQSTGTLRIGVRGDVAGFGSYNEKNNKYYGLEIDIAEELAKRLGYKDVVYTQVTPETRKETLLNGEVDCLIACYSVSDSRKENFDFSDAYYDDSIILMVEKSSLISSTKKLFGATFGTVSGANTAPQLAQYLIDKGFSEGKKVKANKDNTHVVFDTWTLLQFESYKELSDALESGKVDAMACDGAIAKAYTNDDRMLVKDFSIDPQHYAVATNKDSDLSQPVKDAISNMLDDKTIANLIEKWS